MTIPFDSINYISLLQFLGASGIPGQIGPQGLAGSPGLDGCNGTDVSKFMTFQHL